MSPTSYQAAPPRIDFKFKTDVFSSQRWDRGYRFSLFCQAVISSKLLPNQGTAVCVMTAEQKSRSKYQKSVRAALLVAA